MHIIGIALFRTAGTAVLRWLGALNIWQLGCIVLAALALVQHFSLVGERRHTAKVEAHDAATRRSLDAEIKAHAAALDAIKRQNASIAALAKQSAAQQKAAQEAEARAAGRAATAQATADRLAESSRHRPPPGASCEPSEALRRAWQ